MCECRGDGEESTAVTRSSDAAHTYMWKCWAPGMFQAQHWTVFLPPDVGGQVVGVGTGARVLRI